MAMAVAMAAAGRAEIDTRPPFRSVKEAVALFGEKVVGEIYANKIKEVRGGSKVTAAGNARSRIETLESELEETRQSLQKAREENGTLLQRVKALREELEQAKSELRSVKARDLEKPRADPEIEDLKFIENPSKEIVLEDEEREDHLEKTRLVTFASPPSLTRVMTTKEDMLQRPNSVRRRTKKKPLVPLVSWLFPRKKEGQEGPVALIKDY